MKSVRTAVKIFFPCMGMLLLILDSRTALNAASEAINLCIQVVIPSMFAFFVLSIYLTGQLSGIALPILSFIGKICRIPIGSESIMLIGFLGGYPVGAQCVSQAYHSGVLTKKTALRMMGFCSNAGPAFLFGMVSRCFSDPSFAWWLWGIHILSAIITAAIIPGGNDNMNGTQKSPVSLIMALQRSIRIMASVCGWIVVFRVIIAFFQRWFLWLLPAAIQTLLVGFLELSNGCFALQNISDEGIRFVCASVMLAFGGICVGMQTISVTSGLGTGAYFPGKIIHVCISYLLADLMKIILFGGSISPVMTASAVVICALFLFTLGKRENNSSNLLVSGV